LVWLGVLETKVGGVEIAEKYLRDALSHYRGELISGYHRFLMTSLHLAENLRTRKLFEQAAEN
jgi:hypothetical protein